MLKISSSVNSRKDMPMTNVVANPIFARHETFHPRYGWLKKGYDEVFDDPDIFIKEEAAVNLGVGKNMVASIRYWGLAFKIYRELPELKKGKIDTKLRNLALCF